MVFRNNIDSNSNSQSCPYFCTSPENSAITHNIICLLFMIDYFLLEQSVSTVHVQEAANALNCAAVGSNVLDDRATLLLGDAEKGVSSTRPKRPPLQKYKLITTK